MKQIAARFVLAFFAVFAALAALEIGARLIHPTDQAGRFFRLDENTGWSLIPGAEGLHLGNRGGEYKAWVKINSRGLRDREIPYAKRHNAFRILALGDSFTAGLQVPVERTFPKLLEESLNKNGAGRTYEVINAGVSGFGTDNELLFYLHEAVKYKPDIVLLNFCVLNDIQDNYGQFTNPSFLYGKPYFVLEGETLKLVNFPHRPSILSQLRWQANEWLSELKIYRFASTSLDVAVARARVFFSNASAAGRETSDGWPPQWEPAWALTRALLHEVRRQVEASGASLVVVVIPTAELVDPTIWDGSRETSWLRMSPDKVRQQEELLVQFLREHRFRVVRLLPALQEAVRNSGQPVFFHRDPHWNANGQRTAAEAIRRYLVEESLLSGPRP